MTTPSSIPPFDALKAVLEARVRWRAIPETRYTPPPTPEVPNPAPVVTPAHNVLALDPAGLPAPVATPDGAIDLGQMVALLQDAVRRLREMRLRSVHGQAVLTAGTITTSREVTVSWSVPPLASVEAASARMDVGVAWQGRVSAAVKDGSVTSQGCTVVVSAVGTGAVVLTTALPLTVHADGFYNYLPPYEGTST